MSAAALNWQFNMDRQRNMTRILVISQFEKRFRELLEVEFLPDNVGG